MLFRGDVAADDEGVADGGGQVAYVLAVAIGGDLLLDLLDAMAAQRRCVSALRRRAGWYRSARRPCRRRGSGACSPGQRPARSRSLPARTRWRWCPWARRWFARRCEGRGRGCHPRCATNLRRAAASRGCRGRAAQASARPCRRLAQGRRCCRGRPGTGRAPLPVQCSCPWRGSAQTPSPGRRIPALPRCRSGCPACTSCRPSPMMPRPMRRARKAASATSGTTGT